MVPKGEILRIAVLSDIHSNIFALEAVIADIKTRGADVIINLGDILYGPIAPKATFDLLMEHDFTTIRGNQDRQIYESTPWEAASNPTMGFVLEDLGASPLDWMRELPSHCQLTDDIFLCHGAPDDDCIYLLEEIESGLPQLRPDKEIVKLLNGQASGLVLCGHTHISRVVATSSNQLIVNPGSVGLPAYTDDEPVTHSMESFSHHAAYAVIERSGNNWAIQQIRVDYDFRKAAAQAKLRKRNDWAHFLATGRGR